MFTAVHTSIQHRALWVGKITSTSWNLTRLTYRRAIIHHHHRRQHHNHFGYSGCQHQSDEATWERPPLQSRAAASVQPSHLAPSSTTATRIFQTRITCCGAGPASNMGQWLRALRSCWTQLDVSSLDYAKTVTSSNWNWNSAMTVIVKSPLVTIMTRRNYNNIIRIPYSA